MDAPIRTKTTQDKFCFLTDTSSYELPQNILPPQLRNENNFIISLSQVVRWLATQAEEIGVEIYPGFAADKVR